MTPYVKGIHYYPLERGPVYVGDSTRRAFLILTEEMLVNTYEAQINNLIDGDALDMSINLGFNTYIVRRIRLLKIESDINKQFQYLSELLDYLA